MKKTKNYLILYLLILASCGPDLSYKQELKNYNIYATKSDSLIKIKNYKKAIGYSSAAIEITDTLPRAIYLEGIALNELNWLDKAEESFSKVIEIEGQKSKAYKDRAKVYFKKGDSDFVSDIEIFIKNYPDDEEAHLLKRKYFEKKNDFAEAIKEYDIILKKDKDNIPFLIKRSDLYFKNGDYQKSINDLNRILKLKPNNKNIKEKKKTIISLMNNKSNRNILILLLILFYAIYVLLSFRVLKPLANKKALNQVGGIFEISKDPLIIILPIILSLIYFVMITTNLIPNF